MSQSNPPVKQFTFGGVHTASDILKRPPDSATVCSNFRVMPGKYLRLRGGRSFVTSASSGTFSVLHEFRKGEFGGGVYHIVENAGKWRRADLATPALTDLETIGANPPTPGAICTVRDKVFWTNGRGTRAEDSISKPALSSWDGSQVRYVGLDPFIPGTNSLSAALSVNPSGETIIKYSRTFYAGLYNEATGHFSNAVLIGKITNPNPEVDYVGDLTISGLTSIARSSHDAGELAEIYYVIYCTQDGGEVPHLVLTTDGLGPVKTQSASVALVIDDNAAFGDANIVDSTKEAPLDNYPPRLANLIGYANGRVYLAPKKTTTVGSTTNFSYAVTSQEETTVVWSASADDVVDREFLGVPEESFPLSNRKSLPNGESPKLLIAAGGNYGHLLVCTQTGTFLLEETAPGLHEWHAVSWTEGILDKDSHVRTPYGDIWMTQNKELVLLRPGDDQLLHISRDYSSLMRSFGLTAKADYLYDPDNTIDRYQVWNGSGYSVCHDFTLPGYGGPIPGEAYTTTGQTVTIAKSIQYATAGVSPTPTGEVMHVIAIGSSLFAQEGDPRNDKIVPTRDETASGVYSEINGAYIGQWQDFGNHDIRKEFRKVAVIGDAGYSATLGRSPLIISWYGDMSGATQYDLELEKTLQSPTDNSYEARIQDGQRFWYKFKFVLSGHGTEGTYYLWFDDGELTPSVYGAIHRMMLTISDGGKNRY